MRRFRTFIYEIARSLGLVDRDIIGYRDLDGNHQTLMISSSITDTNLFNEY